MKKSNNTTFLKEKTKKGTFYFEIGSFKNKVDNSFEVFYNNKIPRNKKWEITWELFENFHLNHGYKQEELRLDRAVIEFGRRKENCQQTTGSRRC